MPKRLRTAGPGKLTAVHCPRCGWTTWQFGALLRLHREWQGRSETDCARAAGYSLVMWSKWEHGMALPTTESFAHIAQALHLDEQEREELAEAAGLRGLPVGRGYRRLERRS